MIKHIHEQEMPEPISWPNTYTDKIHLNKSVNPTNKQTQYDTYQQIYQMNMHI